MKKLFISQPMKGKTDEAIKEERQQAIREAEQAVGEPVEVIDSFFEGAPADAKPLWFLGKSLELLAQADIAYISVLSDIDTTTTEKETSNESSI